MDRNCDFESLANECESMIQDLEFFEKLLSRANEIIKEQANATRITKTLSYFKMQTLILNKLIDQTSELMQGRIEPSSVPAILGEVVNAKTSLQKLFNGFKELDEIKKDLAAIAILKGSAGRAQSSESCEGISKNMVRDDLMAVKALSEVRTKDFQNLKSELEEQMTLDNHHEVFQI